MLIRSLDDLARAKETALEKQRAHADQCRFQIRIGTASCSEAAGALETLKALQRLAAEENLSNVCIKQVGCTGLCALEPLVQVQETGRPLVTYGRVTPEVAKRIIQQHIHQGLLVQEYLIESVLEPDMRPVPVD